MGCAGKKRAQIEHYLDELNKAHHFFDNLYNDIPAINNKSQLILTDFSDLRKIRLTIKEEDELRTIQLEYKQYLDFLLRIKN